SRACDVRIAPNYPVVGADAFRTATGVHAAAVVKAYRKGDRALMDAVYAAVPASLVGRESEIEVGPMSGRSNVVFWLEKRGLPADFGIAIGARDFDQLRDAFVLRHLTEREHRLLFHFGVRVVRDGVRDRRHRLLARALREPEQRLAAQPRRLCLLGEADERG